MQYLVTDPWYVLSDKDWKDSGNLESDESEPDEDVRMQNATNLIRERLKTKDFYMDRTGYGDWSNCIFSKGNVKIIADEFFADTGKVCIVPFTEEIKSLLIERYDKVLGAIFETDNLESVTFDKSNDDWTKIIVKCSEGYIYSVGVEIEEYLKDKN